MNDIRVWVLILGGVCFAAGLASGTLMTARFTAQPPEQGPFFSDYERMMEERFDLGSDRADILHAIMTDYHREVEEIKNRHMETYMSALEPELREVGTRTTDLIRNRLLPLEQRAEFDRLSLLTPSH